MAKSGRVSRRRFLKQTAAAAGSAVLFPAIIPSSVLGADGQVAPSNRITMGVIGVGDHGTNVDLRGLLHQKDCQIVALCDVDSDNLARGVDITAQAYADRKASGEFKGTFTTGDFRELIARDDIDAVAVATPDHWHVLCALEALRADKDVLCEKPLTLTVHEGVVLCAEAKKRGRITITASENRSKTNFLKACERVRNGRIGKLHTIKTVLPGGRWIRDDLGGKSQEVQPVPDRLDYEMWQGQAPEAPYSPGRLHWNWRWIMDYSGGMLTDWGAHINDVAQWGNGTELTGPISVEGKGIVAEDGYYDTVSEWDLTFEYANGVTLLCTNTPPDVPARGLATIRFEGSDGWIECDWFNIKASSDAILKTEIGPEEIHLRTCPQGEHRDFLDCVKSRKPTYAPFEIGHRTITLSHIGNIAMALQRKLKWDPKAERFTNDPQANTKLSRPMRSPWTLEETSA